VKKVVAAQETKRNGGPSTENGYRVLLMNHGGHGKHGEYFSRRPRPERSRRIYADGHRCCRPRSTRRRIVRRHRPERSRRIYADFRRLLTENWLPTTASSISNRKSSIINSGASGRNQHSTRAETRRRRDQRTTTIVHPLRPRSAALRAGSAPLRETSFLWFQQVTWLPLSEVCAEKQDLNK